MGTSRSLPPGLPDGTFVVNVNDQGEPYLGHVEVAELSEARPYALVNFEGPDEGDEWSNDVPIWNFYAVPGTPEHDRVLAFVTAVRLGAVPTKDLLL